MQHKRLRSDQSPLLTSLLPIQSVFRAHLDATSCLSLRLTNTRFRDLVGSWRSTFRVRGHSTRIYRARECPDCGDWACTLQEVGKQVTWVCNVPDQDSRVCTRTSSETRKGSADSWRQMLASKPGALTTRNSSRTTSLHVHVAGLLRPSLRVNGPNARCQALHVARSPPGSRKGTRTELTASRIAVVLK